VGEAASWCTEQTIGVATTSSDDGEVDVKRMKLDVDTAAAGGAVDVTPADVADAAGYACTTQHADQLGFEVATKRDPEQSTTASQSQCTPRPVFDVIVTDVKPYL